MKLAVADFETDPFLEYRVPQPFAGGIYDGETYRDFWGDDCVQQFIDYLATVEEPMMIYFHNGGGFDFWFLIWFMEEGAKILDAKIVKGNIGIHEIRDSFRILPFPLDQYKKDKIDYSIFERGERNKPTNKRAIRSYMKADCLYLYDLVAAFRRDFGNKLTVGGASIALLQKFHPFDKIPPTDEGAAIDAELRQFYYGGRNQCFRSGVIKGPVTIYDINSAYLYAMKAFKHPTRLDMNVKTGRDARITPRTVFAKIAARNDGALPMRQPDGSLRFDIEHGVFNTTIHEIEAGLDTGTLKIEKVLATYDFLERTDFAEYVDHCGAIRADAKRRGDGATAISWKYVGNSSYGKTAQNPENYRDWAMSHDILAEPWSLEFEAYGWFVWSKPSALRTYYNVAIGASITGATRSLLLRGLANAEGALYCDTDSIVCRSLTGVPFDDVQLGAWKVEAQGDSIAIAGKKLYAVFDGKKPVKKASKGGKISAQDIRDIASGKKPMVQFVNPAPNFKLDGTAHFISRQFKPTVAAQRAPRSQASE